MASSASRSSTESLEPPPYAILPWKFHPPDSLLPTKVSQEAEYDYHGNFSVDRVAHIAASVIRLTTDASFTGMEEVAKEFITIAEQDTTRRACPAKKPYITEAVWVNIRIRPASREWQTPNWHRDYVPFECRCAPEGSPDRTHTKYIFTLLGPHLEVCKPDFLADFAFESVDFIKNLSTGARRQRLGERMREMDKEKIRPRHYIRFDMGKRTRSPIYTEPDITDSESILVSVMFGSAVEIRDMCRLRGLYFWE